MPGKIEGESGIIRDNLHDIYVLDLFFVCYPVFQGSHRDILASSVATYTCDTSGQDAAHRNTRRIIGSPAIDARGFPGKRVESYLDGMKAIMFMVYWGVLTDQRAVYVAQAESDSHTVTRLTLIFSLFRAFPRIS